MDWRKVWVVGRHEFTTNIRRAGFIIMTAIVPTLAILGLLAGSLLAGQARNLGESLSRHFEVGEKPIGVVDYSGYYGSILPKYQGDFVAFPSEAEAEQAVRDDRVSSVLVVPDDYLETGRVVAMSKGSFSAAALTDSTRVHGFMVDHLLAGQVPTSVQQRAVDPLTIEQRVVSTDGTTQGAGPWGMVFTFVVPYILSIFLVMTIFTSSGYLLQSVAEEKESRVIEVVVSSVRPIELLAGKVLGLGALGLLQVLIWLGSAVGFGTGAVTLMVAAGAAAIPVRLMILGVVYYVLGYTFFAILMAGVGALGTTARESQQLAGIFSLGAALPYMLTSFLFTAPNALIARVLSWIPLTAPTMMMLRLPLAEVPTIDIVGSIVMLVLSLPAALWAGAKMFEVGLLIYGKRPTMREIWRILRYG